MQNAKRLGAILLGAFVFFYIFQQVGVGSASVIMVVAVVVILLLRSKRKRESRLDGSASMSGSEIFSDDASVSTASGRRQTLRDMDQHTYVIMANGRREQERGHRLRAESEVLNLQRANRELQEEVDRLKGQPNPKKTHDDMPPDPFAD